MEGISASGKIYAFPFALIEAVPCGIYGVSCIGVFLFSAYIHSPCLHFGIRFGRRQDVDTMLTVSIFYLAISLPRTLSQGMRLSLLTYKYFQALGLIAAKVQAAISYPVREI